MHQKASPRPFFNFVKISQSSHCMQEVLLKKKSFFQKALKKLTLFFSFELSPY